MQTRWLSLGVLVAIIACKRQEARDEKAPPPSPDSPDTARLSGVHYSAPTQVFGVLGVRSSEYFDSIGPGYRIGTLGGRTSPARARDVTTPCISDS